MKTAPGACQLFGDEIEKIDEIRSAHRPEDRRAGIRQDLRQFALRHAAPDAHPGHRPASSTSCASASTSSTTPAACWKRSGSSSAPIFDLEMMEATGSCAGIENYSRYLTGRKPGEPPPTLFEYVPDNALVFADESHVTIPQLGGMFRGDFRRKATLAEYGFRLPSCMDNRPLRFEEWDAMRPQTIAVSATPGHWEMNEARGVFVEQVIRPTGLIDPPVEVRPARTQVDDLVGEVRQVAQAGYRSLVTVLTKRMAEDLTEYLHEQGIRVRYMHFGHRHAGAHRDHPRPAARRLRRAGRHQSAARGPRHSGMRAGRHSRRRQGRLSAQRDHR